MYIRLIEKNDIERLLEIKEQAVLFMKKSNQYVQWNDSYPCRDTYISDLEKKIGYVLVNQSQVEGYFSLSFGVDESYEIVYEGEFKTQKPYGVIHRLMVSDKLRGKNISEFLIEAAFDICRENGISSIRIDTHKDNIPMTKAIISMDFDYAAIIKVADGTERMAYERKL